MKRMLLILILSVIITACSRAASSSQPTQPAANFPTVAPDELPLCKSTDLQTSSNSNPADGAIILGVTLTNSSKNLCTLSNPPIASLVDEGNKTIEIKNVVTLPAQAKPASALIQLGPGDSVIGTLIWRNYCQNPDIKIRKLLLNLGKDQILTIEMKIQTIPRCDAKNEPSTINVGPYSVPP